MSKSRVLISLFGVALVIGLAGQAAKAGRSTKPNDFVITSMTWQKESPVNITEVGYRINKDGKFVVSRLLLRNQSAAPVAEYQLGYLQTFVNNEAEVHLASTRYGWGNDA